MNYTNGLSVQSIDIVDETLTFIAENAGSRADLGENATIVFVYDANGNLGSLTVDLSKDGDSYTGTLADADSLQVSHVILEDLAGNVRAVYNAEVHSGNGVSLSSLSIEAPDEEDPDIEDSDTEGPDEENPDKEELGTNGGTGQYNDNNQSKIDETAGELLQ